MARQRRSVSHGATRAEIQACARSWIDVPVFHKGRTRAGGVDCRGLVINVGIGSGALDDPGDDPILDDYGRLPNAERLVEGLARFMLPGAAVPGDVVALSWGARDLPMHLAVLAELGGRMTFIHAYRLVKPARVIEMGWSAEWPGRACSFWRYPKVVD